MIWVRGGNTKQFALRDSHSKTQKYILTVKENKCPEKSLELL